MANIVLIENDPKTIRDISGYVRQLGEHELRIYKNPERFVSQYVKLPAGQFLPAQHLAIFNDSELKNLGLKTFCKDAPFEGSSIIFTLGAKELTLESIANTESKMLFGVPKEKIIEDKEFVKKAVGDKFFKILKEKLAPPEEDKKEDSEDEGTEEDGDEYETSLVPLAIPMVIENKLWLMYATASLKGEGVELKLRFPGGDIKQLIKDELNARDTGEPINRFDSVDLVLFRYELLNEDLDSWASHLWEQLKENDYFPEENVTRMILLKYEEDDEEKTKYLVPHIDDMICLPLDRLLTIQKMDIVLGLPEVKAPEYLFQQPTHEFIEMSKKMRVKRINDLGIAIENPVPLNRGIVANIYLTLPGDKEPIYVTCKSAYSMQNPNNPKSFLTFFYYFGIDRDTLMKVKGFLRSKHEFREFISLDERDFQYNPDNLFYSEEDKRKKTIAVFTPDPAEGQQICKQIEENFQNVRALYDESYFLFEKKNLSVEEQKIPLKQSDLFTSPIIWSVTSGDGHDFVASPLVPGEEDKICERPANEFFSGAQKWLTMFSGTDETQEALEENLRALPRTKETMVLVDLLHQDGSRRLAELHMKLNEEIIEMSVHPPDLKKIYRTELDSLDGIIVDSSLVPRNVNLWLDRVNKRLTNMQLNPSGTPINAHVLVETEHADVEITRFKNSRIESLQLKPYDSRGLLYHISRIANAPFTQHNADNASWWECNWPGYVAKRVLLEELSEFGATIKHPKSLKVGTNVYLHSFIYENAPSKNLCAKLYSSEPHPNEEGFFQCRFLYYGIPEHFLKYTRSWIRENYSQQDEEEG